MATEGWNDWRLSEVAVNFDAKRIPVKKAERRPGPYPYYGASGIADYVDSYIFDGEYLLVAEDGENLRSRNTPIAFMASGQFWVNNHAHILQGNERANTRYLCYYLESSDIAPYLTGSTRPKLTQGHLKEIRLSLPPRQEQDQIVSLLAALDDKIDLNRRMNETLEAMARAIFKDWFVDFGPVRAKAEGQPAYLAPEFWELFPDALDDDDKPLEWDRAPLGTFITLQRGKTYKSSLKNLPGPYLLGLGSIKRNGGFKSDKLVTYGGESPQNLILEPGDMYVSLKDVTQSADLLGAVARVPAGISKGRLTQDTVKLIFQNDDISPELVYRLLLSTDYRDYCRAHATGTTNLGLSREDFFAYPVTVPQEPVQAAFDSVAGPLIERTESNEAESSALTALRDLLLPKLVSGEIRLNEAEKAVEDVV